MGRMVSQKDALKIRNSCRRKRQIVVFTNGCFDIIHPGHIKYLAKAKQLGDILIVGLNSDKSVRQLKGKGRPVMSQKDRATILSHLDMVDYVTIFGTLTPHTLIKKLMPDVLVKGGDYEESEIVGAREVKASGGKVVIIPFIKGRSTSRIISAFKKL
ncbi:MAG: D-glycero-beta-D-manno-heptose 1-phosphate adenylyltransferase [candidate division Zixibacteria bacterium 4484_95]|nr:MAG: D-glycero-beta-D-manno-heptose 1-phosphate adenylyltransferase [candidate division Zixibacteria bacterium 4484_95]